MRPGQVDCGGLGHGRGQVEGEGGLIGQGAVPGGFEHGAVAQAHGNQGHVNNGGRGGVDRGVHGGFVVGHRSDLHRNLFVAFGAVVAHGRAREGGCFLPRGDGDGDHARGRIIGVSGSGGREAVVRARAVEHRRAQARGLEVDGYVLQGGVGVAGNPVHQLHLVVDFATVFHNGRGRRGGQRRAQRVGENQLHIGAVQGLRRIVPGGFLIVRSGARRPGLGVVHNGGPGRIVRGSHPVFIVVGSIVGFRFQGNGQTLVPFRQFVVNEGYAEGGAVLPLGNAHQDIVGMQGVRPDIRSVGGQA